jgi:hypothetical protein
VVSLTDRQAERWMLNAAAATRQELAERPKLADDQPNQESRERDRNGERRHQNSKDEDPIAACDRFAGSGIALQQGIVPTIRLEEERTQVADDRDPLEEGVDQHIQPHSRQYDSWNPVFKAPEQQPYRQGSVDLVADHRNQPNQRVNAKSKLCPRQPEKRVHDFRSQRENLIKFTGRFAWFCLRRQNLDVYYTSTRIVTSLIAGPVHREQYIRNGETANG